jgi:hypothetical protein
LIFRRLIQHIKKIEATHFTVLIVLSLLDVTVNSLHPGAVGTNFLVNANAAAEPLFRPFQMFTHPVFRIFKVRIWQNKASLLFFSPLIVKVDHMSFQNAHEGAQTTIHLAVSDEVKNVTGKYFSDCKVPYIV